MIPVKPKPPPPPYGKYYQNRSQRLLVPAPQTKNRSENYLIQRGFFRHNVPDYFNRPYAGTETYYPEKPEQHLTSPLIGSNGKTLYQSNNAL